MFDRRAPSESARWHIAGVVLGATVFLGVGIHLFVRQDNEWERVFVPAAARLWAGDDLYRPGEVYLYPPFTAWATLPFLAVSHGSSRLAFVLLNLACVAFVLRGAWTLAGGGRLTRPPEFRAALAGGACGIFYIHNCLVHQQTDVVMAALLVGGCLALTRGRAFLAATGFGLAAAMKCTPLLWAPYLLWRRQPLAAGWLVAVALGVNLLPDLVNRPAEQSTWLGEFAARHLRPLADRDHVPGSWGSEIVYNQSLAGAAQRWLLTAPRWTAEDCTIEKTGAIVSPLILRGLVTGTEFALLLLTAIGFGRPFQSAENAAHQVLEFGAVLLLMLLLSPMSSMAHFGILVVPGFCLARRAFCRGDRLLTILVIGAVIAACASNKDLLGGRLYTVSLWGGSVMLNTLLLLSGCLRELVLKEKPAELATAALRTAA